MIVLNQPKSLEADATQIFEGKEFAAFPPSSEFFKEAYLDELVKPEPKKGARDWSKRAPSRKKAISLADVRKMTNSSSESNLKGGMDATSIQTSQPSVDKDMGSPPPLGGDPGTP
jgi:hypothetical protein